MIKLDEAKRLSGEVRNATLELNRRIADAAKAGLVVEIRTVEVQMISHRSSTPFVEAEAKVDPEDVDTEGES